MDVLSICPKLITLINNGVQNYVGFVTVQVRLNPDRLSYFWLKSYIELRAYFIG